MKKYIKPTAEVVELSVKESLSALPANTQIRKVVRKANILNAATATIYAADSINTFDETTSVQ